jgi:hypothetical protein
MPYLRRKTDVRILTRRNRKPIFTIRRGDGLVSQEPLDRKDHDPWSMVLRRLPGLYPASGVGMDQQHVQKHNRLRLLPRRRILRRCWSFGPPHKDQTLYLEWPYAQPTDDAELHNRLSENGLTKQGGLGNRESRARAWIFRHIKNNASTSKRLQIDG